MSLNETQIALRGLGKQKLAAMAERAKGLGLSPQRYLKHLVEEDLAISQRAKSSSFAELLGEGEKADESEIDQFVERAKVRYHRQSSRRVQE